MSEVPRAGDSGAGRFVRTLQTGYKEAVSTAVANALHTGAPIPPVESLLSTLSAKARIRNRIAKMLSPQWMKRQGVLNAAKEINSSRVWNPLLAAMPRDIQHGTRRHLLGFTNENTAKKIAINNAKFVTGFITQALLAASIGPEAYFAGRYKQDALFMLDVGRRYRRPAQTPEDFMTRLQALVPNPDTTDTRGDGTLLNYLLRNNRFDSTKKRCPAIPLTRLILEQWGRQLDTDPAYRERVKSMVTKRRFRNQRKP